MVWRVQGSVGGQEGCEPGTGRGGENFTGKSPTRISSTNSHPAIFRMNPKSIHLLDDSRRLLEQTHDAPDGHGRVNHDDRPKADAGQS
jgi:hypothetical protein